MAGRRATGALSLAPLALGFAAAVANPTASPSERIDVNAASHAVVTHAGALRSGPTSTSKRLTSVSEGDVVSLFKHGHRSGYVRVQTTEGDVGWVSDRNMLAISEAEVHTPAAEGVVQSG